MWAGTAPGTVVEAGSERSQPMTAKAMVMVASTVTSQTIQVVGTCTRRCVVAVFTVSSLVC